MFTASGTALRLRHWQLEVLRRRACPGRNRRRARWHQDAGALDCPGDNLNPGGGCPGPEWNRAPALGRAAPGGSAALPMAPLEAAPPLFRVSCRPSPNPPPRPCGAETAACHARAPGLPGEVSAIADRKSEFV